MEREIVERQRGRDRMVNKLAVKLSLSHTLSNKSHAYSLLPPPVSSLLLTPLPASLSFFIFISQNFDECKKILVNRGNIYLDTVAGSRDKIAKLGHPFITHGAVSSMQGHILYIILSLLCCVIGMLDT